MRSSSGIFIIVIALCAACNLPSAPRPIQSIPNFSPTRTPFQPARPDERLDYTLDKLPDYRAHLVLHFSGEDVNGSPTTATFETVEEVTPKARHQLARSDQKGERPGSVDIYHLGNSIFVVSSELAGQGGCMKSSTASLDKQPNLAPRPVDIILSVKRGDLIAGNEKVNGAATNHYRLGEAILSLGTPKKMDGEIWVLAGNPRILRFTGWAEGALSLGGGATYGRVEWEYTLTDAAKLTISLPPDCETLVANTFPLPQGADNLTKIGPLLRYDAPLPPMAVINFYRADLSKQGWDIQVDSGGGAAFSLSATKEGQTLQIVVTPYDVNSRVEITRQ